MIINGNVESRKELVIGAGEMGTNYVRSLLKSGTPAHHLSVVDSNPLKLSELEKKIEEQYPGVSLGTLLPSRAVERAYIVSNTPAHLENLHELAALKVPAVLSEKPLCMASQVSNSLSPLLNAFGAGYTAYLINFSPAMEKLIAFMIEKDLVVIEGTGQWAKDRLGNKRPSVGDLEDETTHPVAALALLARIGQTISERAVSATLSHMRYVNDDAQRALAMLDPSVPMQPNSSTNLTLRFLTDRAESPVHIASYSSFASMRQRRTIEVSLSNGEAKPAFGAEIQFDRPNNQGDLLTIHDFTTKKDETFEFTGDKLGLQIRAFQEAANGGTPHPLLKTLREGLGMVFFGDAAMKSHEQSGAYYPIADATTY